MFVLLPASAQAEDEPTVANDVDLRCLLCQHRGVAVRVAGDERAEADARHDRRERSQRGPDLGGGPGVVVVPVGHEVVGHPDAIPAALLRMLRELDEVAVGSGGAGPDAELHRDSLR